MKEIAPVNTSRINGEKLCVEAADGFTACRFPEFEDGGDPEFPVGDGGVRVGVSSPCGASLGEIGNGTVEGEGEDAGDIEGPFAIGPIMIK